MVKFIGKLIHLSKGGFDIMSKENTVRYYKKKYVNLKYKYDELLKEHEKLKDSLIIKIEKSEAPAIFHRDIGHVPVVPLDHVDVHPSPGVSNVPDVSLEHLDINASVPLDHHEVHLSC